MQEYVIPITIQVPDNYQYIGIDNDGEIYAYITKPRYDTKYQGYLPDDTRNCHLHLNTCLINLKTGDINYPSDLLNNRQDTE